MKQVMRAAAMVAVVALVLWAMHVPHSEAEGPTNRRLGKSVSDLRLEDALTAVCADTGVRVAMEIPADRPRVTVKKTSRTVGEVLDDVAASTGAVRMERDGVTVLRPGTYAAVSDAERTYRAAMEEVAQFLDRLSPADKEAIAREEWLDVKKLPLEQQQRVREALLDHAPSEESWNRLLGEAQMAVGFLYDPYLEVEGLKGEPAKRLFIRAGERLLEFDRLVPGTRPGTLRAGFEEGAAQ
jgi:hypothetical protein